MFEVTIKEIIPAQGDKAADEIERYKQVVDTLDLRAVMAAVNHPIRKPRTGKGINDGNKNT